MNQLVQRTDEWFTARLGMATASRVADIVAKTKTGYSTSRANYLAQLVAERLTGKAADTFSSAAMQWGVDHESQAKVAYEFYRDTDISEMGYIEHPSIELSGASPDGAVGSDGLVEIKCPTTATHIETLLSGAIPPRYETQMLWQMACTGRAWCDYVSFDPRMNESMSLFVKRLDRDCDRIAALELEVQGFLSEVNETVMFLLARYQVGEA